MARIKIKDLKIEQTLEQEAMDGVRGGCWFGMINGFLGGFFGSSPTQSVPTYAAPTLTSTTPMSLPYTGSALIADTGSNLTGDTGTNIVGSVGDLTSTTPFSVASVGSNSSARVRTPTKKIPKGYKIIRTPYGVRYGF